MRRIGSGFGYEGEGLCRAEAERAAGDLVYTFTKSWSDGMTGMTLSPLELLEKLAALLRALDVSWVCR